MMKSKQKIVIAGGLALTIIIAITLMVVFGREKPQENPGILGTWYADTLSGDDVLIFNEDGTYTSETQFDKGEYSFDEEGVLQLSNEGSICCKLSIEVKEEKVVCLFDENISYYRTEAEAKSERQETELMGYEDAAAEKIAPILQTGEWTLQNGTDRLVFEDNTLSLMLEDGETRKFTIRYSDAAVNGNLSKITVEIHADKKSDIKLNENKGVITMTQTASTFLLQSAVLPTLEGQRETIWTQEVTDELVSSADDSNLEGELVYISPEDYNPSAEGQGAEIDSPGSTFYENLQEDPFSDYFDEPKPGDVDSKEDKVIKEYKRTLSADGSAVTILFVYEDDTTRSETITRSVDYGSKQKIEIDYGDD